MSQPEPNAEGIYLADTITKLYEHHQDTVVVSGSHGGVYAGYCAAKGHVRAVILNDAGIGKDRAGIGSLAFLDEIRLAAATADSMSCRIADAADMWANGVISHVNQTAADLGCAPGQSVAECATRLRGATASPLPVPRIQEARFVISEGPGEPKVIGIDSASLFRPEDAGQIVLTASHGGLIGGKPDTTVPPGIYAAIFNDAGGCKDGSGFARLANLDERGVAGATVSNATARIGDARSAYGEGVISRVNETAARLGGGVGMPTKTLIERLIEAKRAGNA
jgi:hypothetical protein